MRQKLSGSGIRQNVYPWICAGILLLVPYLILFDPRNIFSIYLFLWVFLTVPVCVLGLLIWGSPNPFFSWQYSGLMMLLTVVVTIWWGIIGYALIYKQTGVLEAGMLRHDPATCLYLSIVTWTTLGYGDVIPTPTNRMWAASEALAGYVVMAIAIGIFLNFIGSKRAEGRPSRPID